MLCELHVRDLGVVADVELVLGSGLIAVPGETGAGKTLVVTAIDLLVGGRADTTMVRPGASEAVVEARVVVGDSEHVIRRVIPAKGRSRAYIDGNLATLAELSALGSTLVDLHGQHDHQSLLAPAVQRAALDRFGAIDLEPLRAARRRVAEVDQQLAALGGDPRERAREIDLLRFQVDELLASGLDDPDEDDRLRDESDLLADASGHTEAAALALGHLTDDHGVLDGLGASLAAVADRSPFAEVVGRLHSVIAELDDVVRELRTIAERIEADPERLEMIGTRRRELQDLRRKYGERLTDVIEWRDRAAERLAELEGHDERAAALDAERIEALAEVAAREGEVERARRAAAPGLAERVAGHLVDLALPNARIEVAVDGIAGRDVTFLFAANPGMPVQPLAKVASGGELARAMLALRLVLTEGPPVLVFDEVDAGIGGAAAIAVGSALAHLADDHQVLVVTHLAQVAAWADQHVVVDKVTSADTTSTSLTVAEGDRRIGELARMLSGSPESEIARRHARELLDSTATST
jgi:DNA repair protein RecN (Recombination protein N)